MATSRNHQGAHGIGQAEEQLNQQADTAEAMQGRNEHDEAVQNAAQQEQSELDEIIEQ